MAQKRKTDQTKTADALLALAGKSGWRAAEAHFDDLPERLAAILHSLDENAVKIAAPSFGGSWRDNLMELIMTRFDLAEKHRAAYGTLPRFILMNPALARRLARTAYRTARGMLVESGLPRHLTRFPPIVAGFGILHGSLIEAWAEDNSADKSKTMAAIDKRIGLFQKALSFLPPGCRG